MGRWDMGDRNYDLSTLGQVGKDLERDYGRINSCEVLALGNGFDKHMKVGTPCPQNWSFYLAFYLT